MIGLKNGVIKLVKHSPDWINSFNIEKAFLIKIADNYIKNIEHIGSTAIINIKAKPIIDIMVGLIDFKNINICSKILENNGYINKGEFGIKNRIFFTKSINEKTTHHLHVVQYDSEFWQKRIHFRDLLNSNKKLRADYEKLKNNLKGKYSNNRELYTNGKSDFIDKILKEYNISNY